MIEATRPGPRIVAIVQARMGSSRLPGKVLADIGGRTMLARVVRRLSRARLVHQIVVATSLAEADDVISDECQRLLVPSFRGSEQDVLDRFQQAASTHGADVVVRITSDCPMIDPEIVDQVVAAFLEHRPDYASNTLTRTYPRGLDTEVMASTALRRAWEDATSGYQREHVTPYIYENPDRFRLLPVRGALDLSEGRWTVDTLDDLAFVRAVYARIGDAEGFGWRDTLELLAREPQLRELNRYVEQKRPEP